MMEVFRRMGDGQTCPDVCRSMKLPPSTESTIIKNAEKNRTVCAACYDSLCNASELQQK